ncbi:nuclear transport factor 2 family protein [Luteibacter sp.]|uniref:nuclear transport factor 2 family protein n=1 Tax=Luteibacter sp. TaxID=1886636 RepID=UPI003F7D185A
MSNDAIPMIQRMYADFNARNIDGVFAVLDDDVAWANGMDGGYVHGKEGLREYWTRQWSMVSPHVDPVAFAPSADGRVAVEVIQTVLDLDGKPLEGQTHGLKDKTVTHVFHVVEGRIVRFDIA